MRSSSPAEAQLKARRAFLRTIRDKLKEMDPHDPRSRIRTNLVPPRVAAPVFSTAWDRRRTFGRFQQHGNPIDTCKVGCGGDAEDSIEHHSRCRILRKMSRDELGLEADWRLPHWLGLGGTSSATVSPSLFHFRGALGA